VAASVRRPPRGNRSVFALLPAIVDAVQLPVVATGGIADARGIAAALLLGASAAQIGTGFLRCPEAKIHPAWATALGETAPEDMMVSRVFSGGAGRSIATNYVRAATAEGAPSPAPYPVQRGLTALDRRRRAPAVCCASASGSWRRRTNPCCRRKRRARSCLAWAGVKSTVAASPTRVSTGTVSTPGTT
jgi:NAD(P)H-dependent flavin oxidoreductase YrpB (nitropropane dioxygenase family)